jgi:hypothetical protein
VKLPISSAAITTSRASANTRALSPISKSSDPTIVAEALIEYYPSLGCPAFLSRAGIPAPSQQSAGGRGSDDFGADIIANVDVA